MPAPAAPRYRLCLRVVRLAVGVLDLGLDRGCLGVDLARDVGDLPGICRALLGSHVLQARADEGVLGLARRLGRLARQLLVELLALLDGQLALLHQVVDDLLGLLGPRGHGAHTRQEELADALAQTERCHDLIAPF